jgi:mannose-6-phosphate isomerase class I
MSTASTYDLHPVVPISEDSSACVEGWPAVLDALRQRVNGQERFLLALECYPGVLLEELTALLRAEFAGARIVDAAQAYKPAEELEAMLRDTLTEDPVFARMSHWTIDDYLDPVRLAALRRELQEVDTSILVVGTGACTILPQADCLVYAGVTRWELQQRQRQKLIGNLGLGNADASAALLYKIAYFVDWRVGDAIRHALYPRVEFFLDCDDRQTPRMLRGPALRGAVEACVQRPFRVEPFFDPGPWGGQWMKQRFALPEGAPNYAWGFDCVPEENTVVFGFGQKRFRLPSIVLVHEHPHALLGDCVYQRFGAEFPIRFDLLDTMGGGNLSLQVHPLKDYIREHFGMDYTQDESYYILDSAPGAQMYLGVRSDADREAMQRDLVLAQGGEKEFPAERYVNVLPTKKHDHFSIPAGTVHCSGAGNVVLEISATPYIFTFKLWDWARLGLHGKPRPIHLDHGLANLQWNRNTGWVERELLNQVEPVDEGNDWREERTGLHALEFIETRRTWFLGIVNHHTAGNLHVLNLVEGEAAMIESPTHAFAPFVIHYAETFIVPAAVGAYTIRPLHNAKTPLATVKAYVRCE